MAGALDTLTNFACSTLSILCPEQPAAPPADPGTIGPGFYQTVTPPQAPGKVPKPAKLVLPPSVQFGLVRYGGAPMRRVVRLGNSGEIALAVAAIEVSGSEAFSVSGSCGLIRPGATCPVTVTLAAKSPGEKTGSLIVGTPGAIEKVALAGAVTAPPPAAKPVAKPLPKPKVVAARPKPKPAPPPPDPRLGATMQSLDNLVATGPTVFDGAETRVASIAARAARPDQWHLQDQNYKGEGATPVFEKNVSSFPVERCRMIPKDTMIPLVLDTPVNSQICGAVLAHVAVDIYGPDGRIRLLKAGARAEGSCEPLDDPDASRIAVEFNSMTRPDGAAIKLAKAQGADAMGQAGIVGEKFDRVFDKYGPTAIASTVGAVVAYLTATETNDDGTTGDSALSAAGQSINQNIAQIVAEELRNATNRKRRIRAKKGTLIHIKPTKHWYFPNPYQIVEVEPKDARLTYTCSDGAFKSSEGRKQNPEN